MVLRWRRFDDFSKLLIAVTASTSAISGWTLWTKEEGKYIWIILAGFGALISIVSKTLDFSIRINEWTESKSLFSELRIKHQILLDDLKINPNFEIFERTEELKQLRLEYANLYKRNIVDAFITQRIERKVQQKLDVYMKQI